MSPLLLHVGFDNIVAVERIVAIAGPASAPIKRLVREATEQHKIIDMTNGRRLKSVIVLDSGHVALAALAPDTLASRIIAGANRAGHLAEDAADAAATHVD